MFRFVDDDFVGIDEMGARVLSVRLDGRLLFNPFPAWLCRQRQYRMAHAPGVP